ncbi:MAG: MarC family protein [Candidatus Omnitrophica bacterium]|nr:MarC family protein [Candidatus Omnitrophota bacterium]
MMGNFLNNFLLAFIPLFVAVDPLGVLPIFVALTANLEKGHKKKIILYSMITALCLALVFIFLGKAIFRALGITIGDFMIAGGIILFCIAVIDLAAPGKQRRIPDEDTGVVPIGTPLIVGPAVLTTCLMLIDQFGVIITVSAVILNLIIVGLIFGWSDILMRALGKAGANALSKVMALLLAAIGVMMIRKGVMRIFGQ